MEKFNSFGGISLNLFKDTFKDEKESTLKKIGVRFELKMLFCARALTSFSLALNVVKMRAHNSSS